MANRDGLGNRLLARTRPRGPRRSSNPRYGLGRGFELLPRREMLTVVINEFMADNQAVLLDEDGAASDWIELHNTGSQSVDLDGWFLTDDDDQLDQWRLPAVTLGANDYLVVFASGKNRAAPGSELHTNFRLANGGEYLAVVHADGVTVEMEYAPEFPDQERDVSYGLGGDGQSRGYFLNPTPGMANIGEPLERADRAILITEIMYHLPTTSIIDPEDVGEEFIEIHNRGLAAVNLEGWSFQSGIGFVFPDVDLAPGEYFVVAANATAFAAKYPQVTNFAAGWTGKLSNSSETLELVDETGNVIDRVTYADSGNWSLRTRGPDDNGHQGWIWSESHDGGGKSLELVNMAVGNQYGQNWAASLSDGGSPGQANSVATLSTAPLILDIAHTPAIPRASDAVTVTARLVDESVTGLAATLFWRVDGEPSFRTVPMVDTGTAADRRAADGVFSAEIPPQSDLAVVEFYVGSSDGSNQRTWPAPVESSGLQQANLLYQVIDAFDPEAGIAPGGPAVYYQVMTAAEREEFTNINRASDAQMNATFISVTGTGVDVVYNAGVRIRGSGSRSEPVPNNRVNFPSDRPWHGVTAINLNVVTVVDQIAGGVLSELSGVHAAEARPAIMFSNGVNLRGGQNVYAHVEALNSEWAQNHFPGNSGGNLYKGRRANESPPGGMDAGLEYLGQDPADYVSYDKLTNAAAADWTDVMALTNILNNTPPDQYVASVSAIVDVDQWLRTLAFTALVENGEFGLFVGDPRGDDYAMYRGDVDPRFRFVSHDFDTLFNSVTRSFFRFRGVPALDRMMDEPVFLARYYEQLVDLIQNVFLDEGTHTVLGEVLGAFAPTNTIGTIQQFMVDRSNWILGQIPGEFLPAAPAESVPAAGAVGVPSLHINEILAINSGSFSHRNRTPDVIELHNAGTTTLDLAGMTLTDDANIPGKYVFPAGAVIGAGDYLVLIADQGLDDQYLHTGFALDGDGEGVYLFDAASRGGALIDGITFGLQIPDKSLGRTDDGSWSLNQPTLGTENILQPLAAPSSVTINEWLAAGQVTSADDFVELYNAALLPVDMGGMYLSDEPNWRPDLFQLPALSFIDAESAVRWIADGDADRGGRHIGFRLNADQEMIALFDRQLDEVDRVLFVWQNADVSQGRLPDGADTFRYFEFPTPGLPNAQQAGQLVDVVEFVSPWRFDDTGVDRGTAWRDPAYDDGNWDTGTAPFGVEGSPIPVPLETPLTIGPTTFYFRTDVVLDEDPRGDSFLLTSMLDDGMIVYINGQEALRLGVPDGEVDFDTPASRFVTNAVLEGPFEIPGTLFRQGTNTVAVELHQGTQGTGDIVLGMALQQLRRPDGVDQGRDIFDALRVTQVNYHPPGNAAVEYVQLANTGEVPLQMAGVQLGGGVEFEFPYLVLDPGEAVVVVEDVAAFRDAHGHVAAGGGRIAGAYQGRLGNNGDSLVVHLPEPHAISALRFEFKDWWLPETDGLGAALQIVDPLGDASAWNQRHAWSAVVPRFPVGEIGDLNQDGVVTADDLTEMENAVRAKSTAVLYDLTEDGVVDAADLHRLVTDGLETLPGDANLDGHVDGTDLASWRAALWTSGARWQSGDFNADGVADGRDFNIWNANKFEVASLLPAGPSRSPRAAAFAAEDGRPPVIVTMDTHAAVGHFQGLEESSADDRGPGNDSAPRLPAMAVDWLLAHRDTVSEQCWRHENGRWGAPKPEAYHESRWSDRVFIELGLDDIVTRPSP